VHYCSKHYAKTDRPEHMLVCERIRRARYEALAYHEAQEGRKQGFNRTNRDVVSMLLV